MKGLEFRTFQAPFSMNFRRPLVDFMLQIQISNGTGSAVVIMNRIRYYPIRSLILCLFFLFPSSSFSDETPAQQSMWSDSPPLDLTASERYHALHFVPRYKEADCIVRLKYSFNGPEIRFVRYDLVLGFRRYFAQNEPSAFFFSQHALEADEKGIIYLIYVDSCPRRFELTRAAARFVEAKEPRYKIIVDDKQIKEWPAKSNTGLWIDNPDYDPEYWLQRKKAMRGEGEAFFRVAEYDEKKGDLFAAFLNYGLAVEYLPDGPLREMAMKRKEENQNALTPEKRSFSDEALEQNIKKLQSILKYINK